MHKTNCYWHCIFYNVFFFCLLLWPLPFEKESAIKSCLFYWGFKPWGYIPANTVLGEDVLKTCWRPLQNNIFQSSSTPFCRRLEDVLNKMSCKHLLKTYWKMKNCYVEDVFKTYWKRRNVCWDYIGVIMSFSLGLYSIGAMTLCLFHQSYV